MNGDALLKLLGPKIKEFVTPVFENARKELLSAIIDTPPPMFVHSLRKLFSFTDEQVTAIWSAAIVALIEQWGKTHDESHSS